MVEFPCRCVFNVEAGDVDVTLHVWGPGAGLFGLGYYKHNEFKIAPGTQYILTDESRNVQLVVNGKWYELKAVTYNYKYIVVHCTCSTMLTNHGELRDWCVL